MNTENLLQPVQFTMPKRNEEEEEKKKELQMLKLTE